MKTHQGIVPDLEFSAIANRTRAIRLTTGLSQRDFAETLGTKYRTIQDIENARNVPSGRILQAYCMHGYDANWILTGAGEMNVNAPYAAIAMLPSALPADFSEGGKLAVSSAAQQQLVQESPEMSPTIQRGDVVFYDRECTTFSSDGLYVITLGDRLKVRRLQHMANNSVLMITDHPAYENMQTPLGDVCIAGYVMGIFLSSEHSQSL